MATDFRSSFDSGFEPSLDSGFAAGVESGFGSGFASSSDSGLSTTAFAMSALLILVISIGSWSKGGWENGRKRAVDEVSLEVLNSRKSGALHLNSHPVDRRHCGRQCHRDTYRQYLAEEMRKLCSFAQQSRTATHLEGCDRSQRKLLQKVLFLPCRTRVIFFISALGFRPGPCPAR